MRPFTRRWVTALVYMVTLCAVSLLVAVTPEVGADAHGTTPVHRGDATIHPHTIFGSGYDLVGSDGGVFVFPTGNPLAGGFFGSLPQINVTVKNIVGITPTNYYSGYDLVGSDGGVFVFPASQSGGYFGSLPGLGINVSNIVGIVPTYHSTGYDLVGSDGGVFAFPVGQTSGFFGSLPGKGISASDIVGIAATPDDKGYWLLGSDGTVYAFGDALFFGDNLEYCAGGERTYGCTYAFPGARFVGIASTPTGKGYWLVTSTGQVENLGDAPSLNHLTGVRASNIVSIVPTSSGYGYWLVASDGGIYAFGDATFIGSLPGLGVSATNIVGAVPTVWTQP